jgi:hypothetical protein
MCILRESLWPDALAISWLKIGFILNWPLWSLLVGGGVNWWTVDRNDELAHPIFNLSFLPFFLSARCQKWFNSTISNFATLFHDCNGGQTFEIISDIFSTKHFLVISNKHPIPLQNSTLSSYLTSWPGNKGNVLYKCLSEHQDKGFDHTTHDSAGRDFTTRPRRHIIRFIHLLRVQNSIKKYYECILTPIIMNYVILTPGHVEIPTFAAKLLPTFAAKIYIY